MSGGREAAAPLRETASGGWLPALRDADPAAWERKGRGEVIRPPH